MSTLRGAQTLCPHCGHGFAIQLYDSLSVLRLPSVRESVLDRTLHAFTCPACRGRVVVTEPVLYTDFDRGLWVACVPEDERPNLAAHEEAVRATFEEAFAADRSPPIVQDMRRDMRLRLVFGYEELREKVVCADHGLDDAVVELLKEQVLLGHPWLLHDGVCLLRLDAVTEEGLELRLLRATSDTRERVADVAVAPREVYALLAREREELVADNPSLFAGPYVNLMRYRLELRPEGEG
ncbi:MAG: hypothetical protein AMXMBFR64_41870 [Myxococcales bacterium]